MFKHSSPIIGHIQLQIVIVVLCCYTLSYIYACTDELVKELRTSDVATSKAAIEKADTYLQSLGQKGFDKTMVNASSKDDDMVRTCVCLVVY